MPHPRTGARGCDGRGNSCAQICTGDFTWKSLYQQTVDEEARLEDECSGDPTAKWGPKKGGNEGPFAIAFAGGLRNFVGLWYSWQLNVIEPSGKLGAVIDSLV
jgi:hypothetical protein